MPRTFKRLIDKQMKKRNLLLLLILAIGITSCNSEGSNKPESSTEKDEVKNEEMPYNESIQNVFFGVPFGATYEEAYEILSQNFWFDKTSTKDRLSLSSKNGDRISFGGKPWDHLDLYFSNNKFYDIQFYQIFKTKESAMSSYSSLYSVVSQKYNMKIVQPNDTTRYGKALGMTKKGQIIIVTCKSYESIEHERWIGVFLEYGDRNFEGISEEL